VENAARASAPIAFTLATTSVSDIGGLKDKPADELTDWLISFNVARLTNGARVVGDRTQLRFFDASGKQYKVAGREGQGPLEFRATSYVCSTRGDTVVVLDGVNRRITLWTSNGDNVREFTPENRAERMGCFDDGTILLGAWEGEQMRLEHRRIDGALISPLGLFGGAPPFTLYFYSQTSLAVRGKRFFVGDPRAQEVKVFDQQGMLVSIVRTADPIARITPDEASAMAPVGGVAGGTAGRTAGAAPPSRRATGPVPTEWPAYNRIHLDDLGRLWIQEFQKTQSAPLFWTAFDTDGRMLGRFTLPAQTRRGDPFLLAFTSGGALIRVEDDNGAVHLVEHPLIRR
jgi:hypothetical protein